MKYWTLIIFLIGSINLFAQPKDAVIEEIGGKKYYVHIVQAGNSLWGIHVLYNVDVEDIVSANPGVENGIKDGQKIIIPVPVKPTVGSGRDLIDTTKTKSIDTPKNQQTQKHTVQPQETLFGISKKYNVTREELIALNPGIENGIKIGQELIIPTMGSGRDLINPNSNPNGGNVIPTPKVTTKISFTDTIVYHTVLAHETMYSISKRFMVPVEELKQINGLKNNRIHAGDVLKIPVRKEKIQKIEIREVKPVETRKVDSTLLFKRKDEYAIAILLPFFLDKGPGYSESYTDLSTEFYMGAQLAIDSLEKLGLNSKIYIYDSQNDTASIKAILKKDEFRHMDMVIGPLFPDKMGIVAKWCKEHKVKFVSPVAANADILKENPYVFTAIPSDLSLIEGAAKYLLNSGIKDQIVLVKPTSPKDIALYDRFRTAFMTLPYKGVRPKLVETNLQDFKTYIKKGGNTLFVVPTVDEATAKKFMNTLVVSSNNVTGNISVFGTKEWLLFEDINGAYKNKYNFQFSAPNEFSYANETTKDMARLYRRTYNADLSKMAVQGYDVMMFFCLKYLMNESPERGIMSNFKMVQKGAGNGFENNNCYILQQQDFEIVKLAETHE